MKILYHHRTQAGGAEGVHIRGIKNAFKELGHEVLDISLIKKEENVNRNTKKNFKEKIFKQLSNLLPEYIFKILEVGYNFFAYFKLRKILKNTKFDLIYERYAYFCFIITFMAKRFSIPLIVEINITSYESDIRKIRFKYLARLVENYVFNNASLLIVVSSYLKENIRKRYKISDNKILVTPNAVNPNEFRLDTNIRNDIKKKYSKNLQNKIVVGFVGVFVSWHGLDYLIDVFNSIIKEKGIFNKISLLLVGDGPIKHEIEKAITKYGIAHHVIITGEVPHNEVKYYIDLFDIAVMPDSNHFGSPMKIFEYMVMGKPVVAPSYEPIKEVIIDGYNGLLFQPKNFEKFAEKLKLLIKDVNKRMRLGDNAKISVLENYTWKKNVEVILKSLPIQ